MIPPDRTKALRRDFIQLFAYYQSAAPILAVAKLVIAYFWIFQLIAPALAAGYPKLWPPSSDGHLLVNILAVFHGILPPAYLFEATTYTLWAFSAFAWIVLLILGAAAHQFAKRAHLWNAVLYLMAFYDVFVCRLFPGILCHHCSVLVSLLIWDRGDRNLIECSILIILTILWLVANDWVVEQTLLESLVFRPESVMVATSTPIRIFSKAILFANCAFGLGVCAPASTQSILIVAAIACYLFVFRCPYHGGGFLIAHTGVPILSGAIASAILSLTVMVFISREEAAGLSLLVAVVAGYIAICLCVSLSRRQRLARAVRVLDQIQDEPSGADRLRSVNHFTMVAVYGMMCAHPACLKLTLFQGATQRWPREPMTWFLYAKFLAIYPEETSTLLMIYKHVRVLRMKGLLMRCLKDQGQAVLRQRDLALSSELNGKLRRLIARQQPTKHRLRHVWDLVIQGNTGAIEAALTGAIEGIDQNEADFKHLFRQFPNNRFLVRQYARFLRDVAADPPRAYEMEEQARILQRGILITKDMAQEFGLAAFQSLPPRLAAGGHANLDHISGPNSVSSFAAPPSEVFEEITLDIDVVSSLRHRIATLTVPSVTGVRRMRLAVLVCLLVPLIAGYSWVQTFWREYSQPLEFLERMTEMQIAVAQVAAFSFRCIGEGLGLFGNFSGRYPRELPPVPLGDSWDTRAQLAAILSGTTDRLEYHAHQQYIGRKTTFAESARKYFSEPIIPYYFYASPDNFSMIFQSFEMCLLDIIVEEEDIATGKVPITAELLNSSKVLNILRNVLPLVEHVNNAHDFAVVYFENWNTDVDSIALILMVTLIVFDVLVGGIALGVEIHWLIRDKHETYRCLLGFPKEKVSALADTFRVVGGSVSVSDSHETMATDITNQDENLLKVFNTAGGSGGRGRDQLPLVLGTILCSIMCITSTAVICDHLIRQSDEISFGSPHLSHIAKAYSYMLVGLMSLLRLTLERTPYRVHLNDSLARPGEIMQLFHFATIEYQTLAFGREDESPYSGFQSIIEEARSALACTASNDPPDLHDALMCYPADMKILFLEDFVAERLVRIESGAIARLNHSNPLYDLLWHFCVTPTYTHVFYPMRGQFVGKLNEKIEIDAGPIQPLFICFIIATAIVEFGVIAYIGYFSTHIQCVLMLLLHFEPKVIMASPRTMKVLSGDFTTSRADAVSRDAEFLGIVFDNLPDPVAYADSQKMIQGMNKACLTTFDALAYEEKDLNSFFDRPEFEGNSASLLTGTAATVTERLVYKQGSNPPLHFEVTANLANAMYVVVFKDISENVGYEAQIREERSKINHLLASILPVPVISRMHHDTDGVCFSVQQATIVLMNFVGFSQWACTRPPKFVLDTLSNFTNKMDALVDKRITLTKVKAYGDCYMVAGGLFSDAQHSAVPHTRDAVHCCLDALEAVKALNLEVDAQLTIKIGVHTGGPIVAGLVGIERPSFELYGLAVDVAQIIEEFGTPMSTIVSRPVYEHLFGGPYRFKECDYEYEGEPIRVYLVSGLD
jgi:class 3 adenylate cyclase